MRARTDLCDLEQAFLSRMAHMEKSMGLRSGLDGGHRSACHEIFPGTTPAPSWLCVRQPHPAGR